MNHYAKMFIVIRHTCDPKCTTVVGGDPGEDNSFAKSPHKCVGGPGVVGEVEKEKGVSNPNVSDFSLLVVGINDCVGWIL